jgi:hypothetical protein
LAGDSVVVGTVCTSVTDEEGGPFVVGGEDGAPFLKITFTAAENWAFVTNEIWIGENITELPIDSEGEIDTEEFPYYWCNSTGQPTWSTIAPLKWYYNCEEVAFFNLSFVAQSTLGQVLPDGTIDPESEIVAFAYEFEGSSADGLYGYYDINILCVCVDEDDVPAEEADLGLAGENLESLSEMCEPSKVLVDEDFESNNNLFGGITSESHALTHFLGRLGQGYSQVEHFFTIPSSGGVPVDSVTLEFDLYQIDEWDDSADSFVVAIGGVGISLLDPLTPAVVDGISWSAEATASGKNLGFLDHDDSIYAVSLSIPSSAFTSGTLNVAFIVTTSNDFDSESAGVDNFKLTANYECGSRRQLDGCTGTADVAREDFESALEGWSNGLVAQDERIGHFLGRMGQENPTTSKAFDVPADAAVAVVAFNVFEFGTWNDADQFVVRVGAADVDLANLIMDHATSGEIEGISWSGIRLNGGDLSSHQVSLSVPKSYFATGKLNLAFSFDLSEGISSKSGGIDDLAITATGICGDGVASDPATHFGMANFNTGDEPSEGDNEDGPHCSSEDFPCEGGDKVYVCHYSVFKGYTTYCVKEADTDIIRFYPNDYCGPCVGGYGTAKQEAKK